jgi:hypothetical protein
MHPRENRILIPQLYRYLFLGVFTATVSSFYYVCTKDPGVVTAENVHTYNGAFQYDNLIFSEKYCESCKLMRYGILRSPVKQNLIY